METLSHLQQRLCPSEGNSTKFDQARLVEWTTKFCILLLIDEERVHASSVGTPAQLRAVLDELLILARQCGVNMETAVWGKYPNLCPYCLKKPCLCGLQKIGPPKRLNIPLPQEGLALGDLQRMLKEIYPGHSSLIQECIDVIREVTELSLVVWYSENSNQGVKEEFADIFARLMRFANTLGISLEGIIP